MTQHLAERFVHQCLKVLDDAAEQLERAIDEWNVSHKRFINTRSALEEAMKNLREVLAGDD